MWRRLAAAAAAWTVTCLGVAHADSFKSAPNMSFMFVASSKEAYFSTWEVRDLKGLNALRARAKFEWFGADPKWLPGWKIDLAAGEERLMLAAGGREGDPTQLSLQLWRDKSLVREEFFELRPKSSNAIDVSIHWTPEGVVTAEIGRRGTRLTERRTAKLSSQPQRLGVHVSTAGVSFEPLELGTGEP